MNFLSLCLGVGFFRLVIEKAIKKWQQKKRQLKENQPKRSG